MSGIPISDTPLSPFNPHSGDRRDSGNWIHKRSLSSLVPRLGEMPTDPSLFEKVIIYPHRLRSCSQP